MKTCPNCNSKLQNNNHLCEYCGTIIDASSHIKQSNYELSFNLKFKELELLFLHENIELNEIDFDFLVKLSTTEFIGISNGILKTNLSFKNQKNIKVSKRLKYDGAIIHTHEVIELNKNQADYFRENDAEIYFFGQDLASYLYDLKEELDEELNEKYELEELNDEEIIFFVTLDEVISGGWEIDEVPSKIQSELQELDANISSGLQLFFDSVLPPIIDDIDIDKGFKLTTIQDKFKELSLKTESFQLLKTNKYNYSTTFEIVLRMETIEGFDISQYFLNTKFIESSDIDIYHEDNWWYEEPHLYESVLEIYFDHDVVEEVSSISG